MGKYGECLTPSEARDLLFAYVKREGLDHPTASEDSSEGATQRTPRTFLYMSLCLVLFSMLSIVFLAIFCIANYLLLTGVAVRTTGMMRWISCLKIARLSWLV